MGIEATNALLRFARQWFDERTVTSVFEPLLADHQRMWMDAPPAARFRVSLKTIAAFASAFLWTAPRVVMLTPAPPSTTRRILSRIIIFTSIATAVLTMPIVYAMREAPWQTVLVLAFFLLPSIMVTVLPFAMPWVVDGLRRHRAATQAERIIALRTAFVCVAFAFVFVGWAMPMANQAYREASAPEGMRPPLRGARELTLTELAFHPPLRMQDGRNPKEIRREINSRLVLAVLPAVVLWVRWGAHSGPRRRWLSPLPLPLETALGFVAFFWLYLASIAIEPRLGMRAGSGMWLAPIALIAAGILRSVLSRRFNASSLG